MGQGSAQSTAVAVPASTLAASGGAALRPLRLTYIIDMVDTDLAGTENQLLKMIDGLGRAGWSVSLICLRDHPWMHEHRERIGCGLLVIPVHNFRHPGTGIGFVRLAWHLRRTAPDVVHTFFPVSNIVGVAAARLAGVPAIVSSRRDHGEWMTPGYLRATRIANRWVGKVVANSTAVRELTVVREKLPPERVMVILNGLDSVRFEGRVSGEALRQELSIPPGHLVVGIVANFRPMKHHETFLLAAQEVLRRRSDVSFVLVGCGPRMREMQALAAQLGLGERCVFAGAREDVKTFLGLMDVGVNCSEREGLSNAIMEYMAAGLPSVVAAAGGNADLVSDGVEGHLFPVGDWKRLAALLERVLAAPAVREALGARAREKIRREMNLERMVDRYDQLYRKLLGG